MVGMGRSLNISHSVCACLCLFFTVCPSVRWFHPSEWGSALGSHLTCLMGRQELVGSMDNPPRKSQMGALGVEDFPALTSLWEFLGSQLSGPVMDALCQEGQPERAEQPGCVSSGTANCY